MKKLYTKGRCNYSNNFLKLSKVLVIMQFDVKQITAYFNIALVVLFLVFIGGTLLAAVRGLRRGVWKSTHNMVFMLTLIVIAFVTLDPLCKFVENFDLSQFIHGSLFIKQTQDGVETMVYYIPVTSVKETATEFVKALYYVFDISASPSSLTNIAFAIAESAIKIVIFIVDIILILIFGNLFSFITWYAIAQHLVPKFVRKTVKVRWLGAIETAVTFVITTALFFTPLTSLVNTLNQSYQNNKPKSDNEMVMNVGNFVDAYNNSLFAKILFNWSADENGMTFDTKFFSTFTTGVSEDVSVSLLGELANMSNLIVIGVSGMTQTEEGQFAYDATQLLTKEIVDSAFSCLTKSNLLTSVIPLAADIALNSELLKEFIPERLLDVSDIDWKNEIKNVQDMIDCLFDSGVMDSLVVNNETGKKEFRSFKDQDVVEFIEEILYKPNFDEVLNVFKSIDNSKLLARVVPALVNFAKTLDTTGATSQYLPLSWEEICEFKWGYELYVLFDFLHKTVTIDRDFLKSVLIKAGSYKPKEGETIKPLEEVISLHADEFTDLIVGKMNTSGELVDVDSSGRTKVFNNGQRIAGKNYCLFDMMLFEKVLPRLTDMLFDLDIEGFKDIRDKISATDIDSFHQAVAKLSEGKVLVNYKKEFHAVLNVVAELGKDTELLQCFSAPEGFNLLMEDPNNFFSIKKQHITALQNALGKMSASNLIYSAVVPIIKNYISEPNISGSFTDMGLNVDVIISAINHDMKRQPVQRTFFGDIASLLDGWDDLASIFSLVGSTDGNNMLDKFKDDALVDSFVNIMTLIFENPLINPDPEPGDTYEKNENLYGLLGFVFDFTSSMGLTVTRDRMREVEAHNGWTGENGEFRAIANIIKYIASHDVMKAADMFTDGLTRTAVSNLKDEGEGKVGLPKLFELVDKSYIFKMSLGPFLDDMFGDALSGFLIDQGTSVSFSNIINWTEEGQNIANLLTSLISLIPENDSEAKDFLTNFDMSKLHDIVELNDMLHQLSHSGIFTYVDEHGVSHYQFGAWFYQKISDAMVKFNVNTTEYDLLADPKPGENASWDWKESWGIKPGNENADQYFVDYANKYNPNGTETDTHMIAYRDFVYLAGKANTDESLVTDWCDYTNFTTKQTAFLAAHETDLTTTYKNNDWQAYFASDDFITAYNDVFEVDEISKVCKFMTYALRVVEKRTAGANAGTQIPFNELPIPVLEGLLNSINETSCLRICLYNFYRIADENLLSGYSAFNTSSSYNIYIVDAEYPINDFEHARPARQAELDKLMNFYKVIDEAKTNGVINGSDFDYSKMNQDGFLTKMKNAINDFNSSYIFHRSGSGKVNSMTTFQGLFNSMLSESSVKDVIYLANSPKDSNATNYTDKVSKIEYLVKSTFLTDKQINDGALNLNNERAKQTDEINNLMDCVDSLYSLKDKDGNATTAIEQADMNKSDNIDVIETLFDRLNNSNLLYDCLPNSIYNIFVENNQLSIKNGDQTVEFNRVDPFYHYYYNDTVKRSSVDYSAKYLSTDISGIISLLTDYQEFNTQLDGKEMSDPATLKALTGTGGALKLVLKDMHDSNLFHTPARGEDGSSYYTNKYETGYTLFEELISKICSFVKLDDFAYDSSYELDVSTYGSAANKLTARIKEITKADDTGISSNVYHTAQGHAWYDEIDSIMNLANTAADMASGSSLDVSSFELNKLSPTQIKNMLTAVNSSDILADALPKFIKDGFTSINLGTLTSYSDVNYAYYRLGQTVYGGENANSPAGSEIDNIYQVMSVLYNEGTQTYNTDMNNMTEFAKGATGEARLTGLLKFLYQSHIFNTSLSGTYKQYNVVDGHNVTAQGIMLYNSLGNDLSAYIARDADKLTPAKSALDKISTLSTIVHMENYFESEVDITYQVEAKGLKRLVDLTDGQIDASTFNDNNVNTIKAKKSLILGIVESAYNATAETDPTLNKRSAITSEFISGLFNTILENQYTKLEAKPTYRYTVFSFGNDDASTLDISDYSELNSVERDGLEGMLDALDYIGATSTPASLQANREQIKAKFAMMGQEPGKNAHMAQALYLTEAHQYLKNLRNPLVTNGGEMFVPVDETSNDPTGSNNVYSNSFSFKEYGERIDNFLNGATIGF